jgi:hypothetical protein
MVFFKIHTLPSFPEFLSAKILGESINLNLIWIALEFSKVKIQAMTGISSIFKTDTSQRARTALRLRGFAVQSPTYSK